MNTPEPAIASSVIRRYGSLSMGGRIRRTAPKEPGLYTLYEILGEHNAHLGWKWVREIREVKA